MNWFFISFQQYHGICYLSGWPPGTLSLNRAFHLIIRILPRFYQRLNSRVEIIYKQIFKGVLMSGVIMYSLEFVLPFSAFSLDLFALLWGSGCTFCRTSIPVWYLLQPSLIWHVLSLKDKDEYEDGYVLMF